MSYLCESCVKLKEKGKSILVRNSSYLIQLKNDSACKRIYLCFQSREGESQLLVDFCPKCGRPYYGLGGFLND